MLQSLAVAPSTVINQYQPTRKTYPVYEAIRQLMRRMKASLVSAGIGWVTASLAFSIVIGLAEDTLPQSLPVTFFVTLLYSAPLIGAVWLCLLWPLYVSIPTKSVLWKPVVCVPLGIISGVGLYYAFMRVVFTIEPGANLLPHLAVGAITGGITVLTGLLQKSNERKPA